MAKLIVFQDDYERALLCASEYHNWHTQPNLLGSETDLFLMTCQSLCIAWLSEDTISIDRLQRRLYGIAHKHRIYVHWLAKSDIPQPNIFILSGWSKESLAVVRCS